MSDPAVEAARRASNGKGMSYRELAAAHEMAKPIRELHRPMTREELRDTWPGYVGVERAVCAECTDVNRLRWLDECATAKCVYTTEELAAASQNRAEVEWTLADYFAWLAKPGNGDAMCTCGHPYTSHYADLSGCGHVDGCCECRGWNLDQEKAAR